jgi:hypothetical protein
MPLKEINFFSRERNWTRGFEWYEAIFARCPAAALAGELSTSYLSDPLTPGRIRDRYPEAKLFVCLREPVDRALSNYYNDLMTGTVPAGTSFADALGKHPEYLDRGMYARHLRRYLDHFPRHQVHVAVFDDARRDPLGFICDLYAFLGVETGFRPSMLGRPVAEGRVPRSPGVERAMARLSGLRRWVAVRPVWWLAKRSGLGDRLRSLNTRQRFQPAAVSPEERQRLFGHFEADVSDLEGLLGRALDWRPR